MPIPQRLSSRLRSRASAVRLVLTVWISKPTPARRQQGTLGSRQGVGAKLGNTGRPWPRLNIAAGAPLQIHEQKTMIKG